jgi:hypothetical protein
MPKTILVLAANPVDTARLRLNAEVRGIETALKLGGARDTLRLHSVFAARVADARSVETFKAQ